MLTNDSFVLGWHCCGVLVWQLIWGVNISHASPEYLQPERVISGSCNYLPGKEIYVQSAVFVDISCFFSK